MIPLYAARIEDLGPRDFAKAECAACGHDRLILASALHRGLRLRRLPACLISRLGCGAGSAMRGGTLRFRLVGKFMTAPAILRGIPRISVISLSCPIAAVISLADTPAQSAQCSAMSDDTGIGILLPPRP